MWTIWIHILAAKPDSWTLTTFKPLTRYFSGAKYLIHPHLGKLFFLFRKVYIYIHIYIYIYIYWGWSPNVVRMLQFTQILPSFWLAYWFCMNRGYLNFKSINPRVYPGLSSYFFSRSNGCCGVSTHFKTANKLRSSSGHVDLPVASQIILKSHD